mmetsp:Transcript_3311/g.8357  ORF Transcript_3311/g.8357 Transcript_3311/m.8357 type:complete len:521 (+) Transcript_3311:279-1841(+)
MTKLKQPKRKRSEQTRESDICRKQRNRHTTQMLLKGLWDLEAKARQRESPSAPPRKNRETMQAVLEATVNRIRAMQGHLPLPTSNNSPLSPGGAVPCGSPIGVHEGCEEALARSRSLGPDEVVAGIGLGNFEGTTSLSGGDIRKGLLASTTLGVLYVCLDDWVVRSSSSAMEAVCSWEPLRGYTGQDISLLVHPDDHYQLQVFRDQVAGIKPGDPIVLSVRLLRACMDGKVLVTTYARQILEVAHVAPDATHENKVHVLFTCVLDADSVKPLKFGADDRRSFQDLASTVSGCMLIDNTRSTESMVKMSAIAKDNGVTTGNDSHIADFLMGVSGTLGRTLGITDMVKWVRNHAMSALSGVVRTHYLIGLDPSGVPWLQKSASLVAFGFMSKYRAYINMSMSGNPAALSRMQDRSVCYGIRRTASNGLAYVSFCWADPKGGRTPENKPRLFTVGHASWEKDDQAAVHGHDIILIKKDPGPEAQRFDIRSTRTGPPNPELVEHFLKFGRQFSGLPIGFSGIDD